MPLISLPEALYTFAHSRANTQSQAHIKPFHRYVAARLVMEGGFSPDDIRPRPPLEHVVNGRTSQKRHYLRFEPALEDNSEVNLIGGLKSKDIDVVVSREFVGPVLAISIKGARNAFRNLVNRMEEAPGDCTNIHMAYPNLVYGYAFLLRGNRMGAVTNDNSHIFSPDPNGNIKPRDLCLKEEEPTNDVRHFVQAMSRVSGRQDVRNEVSKYESVSINVVDPSEADAPYIMEGLFQQEGLLDLRDFFDRLYALYDLRYVYISDRSERQHARFVWESESEVFERGEIQNFGECRFRTTADIRGGDR